MSLLLLFQGGVQQDIPPPPPPPPVVAFDFLSHGDAAIGLGALGDVTGDGPALAVSGAASTDAGDGATAGIGPGPTTTIQ